MSEDSDEDPLYEPEERESDGSESEGCVCLGARLYSVHMSHSHPQKKHYLLQEININYNVSKYTYKLCMLLFSSININCLFMYVYFYKTYEKSIKADIIILFFYVNTNFRRLSDHWCKKNDIE